MADTIDNVSERLTRLEVTTAQGFHDCAVRDADLGKRIEALGRKIDTHSEIIRTEIRALADTARLTTETIQLALTDHSRRLDNLEDK